MRKKVNIKIGDTNPPQKFDTMIDLNVGDRVVVETPDGANWGTVAAIPCEARGKTDNNLVLRVADKEDDKTINKMITSAAYAMRIATEKIEKFKLAMKPLSAAYNLDASKVVIQYHAENRVDFRELVKELAYTLRTRIELKQIGPRDEAKIIGALGPCGMPCCCERFLSNFDNVSIKMAKNQNISLQPNKINGMCGRLLCCLAYENDHYVETGEKMPRYGSEVQTPDGKGVAQDNNMISETVNVKFQNGDVYTHKCYKLGELKCKHCGKRD